jgi:hypothetical protein
MLESFQPVQGRIRLDGHHLQRRFLFLEETAAVPITVPLVPRPATRCVTSPWVCSQISGPVER